MQKRNYQKELDKLIALNTEKQIVPTLLLHSCCAPCSSYCLLYLAQYFHITVFYYNPNITEETEYRHRVEEQKRLIKAFNEKKESGRYPIGWLEGAYEPARFYEAARGLEDVPEGGARCRKCFALRLSETGTLAAKQGFDYFTTTLTISPLKNAEAINTIGEAVAEKCGVTWLPSDFKKKEGYKQSILLSKEYDLYRQNYCGCKFSKN